MRVMILAFLAAISASSVQAFCGFYVARADGDLFNEASKVVYVRDGRQSVITMSSDYRGAASDFAMIVPAPTILRRDQIRTVDVETVAHLDAYSAPRLVEYFDDDPCGQQIMYEMAMQKDGSDATPPSGPRSFGVTVEANYAVGVYDIAILSAKESGGLVTYLVSEGYNIPDGAEDALQKYIANRMKFFVARVNLDRHDAAKAAELPPLQISFKSNDFMLPLQLGKVNSAGTQDLLVMTLTRKGRVEAANYANEHIPSNIDVPIFVKDDFGDFYRSLFANLSTRDTVQTEYAWDMAWCDPCAADPLSVAQLKELGVNWLNADDARAPDVFLTRLHMRYDETSFAEDLALKVTNDRENFQGRYIINNPYMGPTECNAKERRAYRSSVAASMLREAGELQSLTGWDARGITKKIRASVPRRFWY